MIIAIDFDGIIVKDKYPYIGDPIPNAKEAILELHNEGHYLILWTCRCGKELQDAVNYLHENGIIFDAINENAPSQIEKYGTDSRKIFADVYIDDRQVFNLPYTWLDIYHRIVKYSRIKKINYD